MWSPVNVDVVVDVLGWFPTRSFTGLTPARLMDARSSGVTVDSNFARGPKAHWRHFFRSDDCASGWCAFGGCCFGGAERDRGTCRQLADGTPCSNATRFMTAPAPSSVPPFRANFSILRRRSEWKRSTSKSWAAAMVAASDPSGTNGTEDGEDTKPSSSPTRRPRASGALLHAGGSCLALLSVAEPGKCVNAVAGCNRPAVPTLIVMSDTGILDGTLTSRGLLPGR
ncbi:hypothetical protein BH10ACT2_BH10ACT2_11320 [soil metagenome]